VNAAQTVRNINNAFHEDVTNERILYRWIEKFHFGNFNLENEPSERIN